MTTNVFNEKQIAWQEALNNFSKKENLIFLETGRIRNPDWKNSDGNSTDFFSNQLCIKKCYSIDNDSENFSGFSTTEEYCKHILTKQQLSKIIFLNGDSVDIIKKLNEKIDVVLLDSLNDSDLIFNEFINIMEKMSSESLIIVDDINDKGVKGKKIIKLLEKNNIPFFVKKANPNDCMFFYLNEKLVYEMLHNNISS
jgi:hypothetical protein